MYYISIDVGKFNHCACVISSEGEVLIEPFSSLIILMVLNRLSKLSKNLNHPDILLVWRLQAITATILPSF